jgi:hypothetical protein
MRFGLQAFVHGDITCKSLRVDPTVRLCGKLNVHKDVPMVLNKDGEPVEVSCRRGSFEFSGRLHD